MDTQIDLNTLSKEQLVFLVQVRGQALQMHCAADDKLIERGELSPQRAEGFTKAKIDIMSGLMVAEEQILAGHEKPPLAN
ncbi:hypothetical protein SAMN05880590_102719 [Rhizobium sp. RU35A]|uniref:hypothetical protein n=1 Tax=Rhizobium sp. RU35A TaxID=1907414 RepID=UPI000953A134|nr:hypothetical protein [Rhizobium sp. RU35A]SIQ23492.1 hypothetical protein SAMN05880590_102719 [Rhizobium sp. RU35A]